MPVYNFPVYYFTSNEAPTARSIRLTPSFQKKFNVGYDTFRLVVVASDAVNMPAEIFLYLRRPFVSGQAEPLDRFETVCSGVDFDSVPVGEPIEGSDPPYLRHATLDLRFVSAAQAEAAYNAIVELVRNLVRSLDRNDDLVQLPAVVVTS